MHMLANFLLGFVAISLWVAMWVIPFRQKLYRWIDQRWPR